MAACSRRTAFCLFFFNDTATTEIYTLSLHDALPIFLAGYYGSPAGWAVVGYATFPGRCGDLRSEEHTSELQSRLHLVCRLLLEKKKITTNTVGSRSATRSRPSQMPTSTSATPPSISR